MQRLALLIICGLTFIGIGPSVSPLMADDRRSDNVTISFGQWKANEPPPPEGVGPLDRFLVNPAGGAGNNHELIPKKVTIKEGDAVNFVISGLHLAVIYDDGTKPEQIDITALVPNITTAGGIIDDPNNRIYRGFNPNAIPNNNQRDRAETVHFSKPGTYLVICGVRNHFVDDQMYGFVEVKEVKVKVRK
jgi:plastocyanin